LSLGDGGSEDRRSDRKREKNTESRHGDKRIPRSA
jgi:hypothetical protein